MPNRAERRQRKLRFKRGWTPVLVSDTKNWKWINHPEENGVRFRLRPLTDGEYQEASDAVYDNIVEKSRLMGADLFKVLQDPDRVAAARAVQKETISPLIAIKYAVQEWTYEMPCDETHKGDLDRATQMFLHDEIVEMNQLRPLSKVKESSGESDTAVSPTISQTPGMSDKPASISPSVNGPHLVDEPSRAT